MADGVCRLSAAEFCSELRTAVPLSFGAVVTAGRDCKHSRTAEAERCVRVCSLPKRFWEDALELGCETVS